MDTIVHVCTANRIHLIPAICKNFVDNINFVNQLFVLVGTKDADKIIYQQIFENSICSKCIFMNNLEEVYKECGKWKKYMILTHGFSYLHSFKFKLYGCLNIHWICWGDSVSKSNSLGALIYRPVKKYIMSSLKGIITLMKPDKEKLINLYKLKNVEFVSYMSSSSSNHYSRSYLSEDVVQYRVLLGNNTNCMEYHNDVLEILKKYSGKIDVHCLLNYNLNKEDKLYKSIVEKGHEIFGNRFKTIEDLMTQGEYLDFLKQYDVYICAKPEQTGLGANYRCLRLGKKVFLSGNNYEWFSSLGCKLYKVNDLYNLNFNDFIAPLSLEDKNKNLDTINMFLDEDKNVKQWITYINKHINV